MSVKLVVALTDGKLCSCRLFEALLHAVPPLSEKRESAA